MTIQRLVLDFRTDELVVRVLYRTKGGAGPNTKARRRAVTELTREGLGATLEAFGGACGCRRHIGVHHKGGCSFGRSLTGDSKANEESLVDVAQEPGREERLAERETKEEQA